MSTYGAGTYGDPTGTYGTLVSLTNATSTATVTVTTISRSSVTAAVTSTASVRD